ncbi:hypothetical protein [Xanthocytophaga agilis]|uniref:Uncharacterized protein n=1 Tax=Xanthocytophaga agilis TaxID=3048010 RepID=A0AAE3R1P4_9BACT|nr:hypothetical protein [Xanthocytophaga agilis]MDJ1502041.1 hypothetical protein [Xanthocytophaga agilis]
MLKTLELLAILKGRLKLSHFDCIERSLAPGTFFVSRKDMGHDKTRRCAPTLVQNNPYHSNGNQ